MQGIPDLAWGKFKKAIDEDKLVEWHPLVDHCADVSACLEALLRQPTIARRLCKSGNIDALDERLLQRLAAIAFLHDIGKANWGFQRKVFPGARVKGVGHIKELYPLFNSPDLELRFCTAIPWKEIMTWGEESAVCGLLIAAISHHGKPWNTAESAYTHKYWEPAPDGYDPFEALRELGEALRLWFPLAFGSGAPALPREPEFQHAYSGLVMLADWLGSDTDFFRYSKADDTDRMTFARAKASEMLRAVGLDVAGKRKISRDAALSFDGVFPFPPNRMQQAAADLKTGQLVILESETGSGKTEAALWRFKELFEAGEVDGLYFALPTRVAATQIFERVGEAVSKMFPKSDCPAVVLAVPGYVRVDQAEGKLLPGFEVLWNDDARGAEAHKRWAAENPKRFLAAQIAVGTIDQALLSNLCVSHAHMRSTALLRHLLIVDEVHASDVYMNALLHSVLGIHIGAGSHALLMSATLGGGARSEYLLGTGTTAPSVEECIATPYPCVSWVEGSTPKSAETGSNGRKKTVNGDLVPWIDDARKIAQEALCAARKGAKVLVVRNTVDGAVAVQLAVEALIESSGDRVGDKELLFTCADVVTLHHGRFAREDRQLLDKAVEICVGRARPPGGVILVGTQTLEQSLDIDADLLITDICPMDVLLQRIGRLHRHQRKERDGRPGGFDSARCVIATPVERDLSSHLTDSAHGLGWVYPDLRIIEATWRLLEIHASLEIPRMNRELVERATHPGALHAIELELGRAWEEHGHKIIGETSAKTGVAALHKIPRERAFGDLVFPDVDEKITTRLGADDRLADLAGETGAMPMGPFGRTVRIITIPAHLACGAALDEGARVIEQQAAGFTFEYGGLRYDYGRYGLRRGTV